MKKWWPVLFAAALCACAPFADIARTRGTGQGQGLDGAFVSNSPAVAVVPAPGLALLFSGLVSVLPSKEGTFTGGAASEVWYAVYGAPGRQLVVMLADAPYNMEWPYTSMFTERRGLPVMREGDASYFGLPMTGATYVRPAALDPWMKGLADAGAQAVWQGDMLVRQIVWRTDANRTKLMIEYREPVPQGFQSHPISDYDAATAFEARAAAAFRVVPEAPSAGITPASGNPASVNPRLLAATLGEVVPAWRFIIR